MRLKLMLGRPLPDWARAAGIQVLLGVFARTFDVVPPRVVGWPADDALYAFREFSAACIEEALVSPDYAASKRVELESRARDLGSLVRHALRPRDDELAELVSFLYAAIAIDVVGLGPEGSQTKFHRPARLQFRRCYFSERYTPEICAFMSAFDSGFVGGLCGGGSLQFESRITAGAPCCLASLVDEIS